MRRVELLDDQTPWERARREGWEGVIAKRRGSPYEHRRSKHWLKMKCEASQELVVGGFTDPQGARVGLGALLVGYYEDGDFVFAGKIGTGFDTKLLLDLRRRLDAIELPESPFTKATGLPRLRAHWVRPEIVVQVAFIEWTVHGKLRHPRLLGVRLDKDARARHTRAAVITHPEKVLFPDDGITKGDLAAYYEAMAPVILPHLRGRPVTMERYPAGIGEKGFWQKDVSKGFPEWLQRVEVPKKDGVVHHPVVTDTRSLLWITNQNTITQHVWTSRIPDLHYPDICVFDLDPSQDDTRSGARRGDRPARSARGADTALVDQDVRLEGLPHRRPDRRQDTHRTGRALCQRRGNAVREPRARSPHTGVQQGRSPRADLCRHREKRLQRHVCGGLYRAREGAARRCPRRARGKRSSVAR